MRRTKKLHISPHPINNKGGPRNIVVSTRKRQQLSFMIKQLGAHNREVGLVRDLESVLEGVAHHNSPI
jgi:hypothetical protein